MNIYFNHQASRRRFERLVSSIADRRRSASQRGQWKIQRPRHSLTQQVTMVIGDRLWGPVRVHRYLTSEALVSFSVSDSDFALAGRL